MCAFVWVNVCWCLCRGVDVCGVVVSVRVVKFLLFQCIIIIIPNACNIYVILMCTLRISTSQVSLVEGIDSFKPFWVLGPSNSASTGRRSPVTRQPIHPHKFGENCHLNSCHIHVHVLAI